MNKTKREEEREDGQKRAKRKDKGLKIKEEGGPGICLFSPFSAKL